MSSERPRIVLVGLGPTTASALAGLVDRFDVVALVRDAADDVAQRATLLGVPVTVDSSVHALRLLVDRHRPDAVVISSYHRILPADLVERCPFVNVHYAPLPRYRGRATVNWAIINGESTVSISIHTVAPGLDAGGILYQEHVPIGPTDTVTDLYDRLNELQQVAIADAVARRLDGDEGDPQDERAATYACTRIPEDSEIDWVLPVDATDRLVRALTPPFPGAYTFVGLRRLWIRWGEPRRDAPPYEGRIPGRVVGRSAVDGWVDVLTGDGVFRLHQVQLDGAQVSRAADLIRSVKQTLGLRTHDLLARIAELEDRLDSGYTAPTAFKENLRS
jgi:methionyl-tRNA formyltransferase